MHPSLGAKVVRAAARIAALARAARVAARRAPGDDDAVTASDRRDSFADLFDDSRAFVPEQDRELHTPAAGLDDMQIGVAHTARLDTHLDLGGAGRVERDLLDERRCAGLCIDQPARHDAARRNCSSSGTSGNWNVPTASGLVTTLSPSSSIVSWSRVTGANGSRSVSAACTRNTENGPRIERRCT